MGSWIAWPTHLQRHRRRSREGFDKEGQKNIETLKHL